MKGVIVFAPGAFNASLGISIGIGATLGVGFHSFRGGFFLTKKYLHYSYLATKTYVVGNH